MDDSHHKLTFSGFQCPQCKSKVCELPNDCDVCGLALVSSPHLARSYHHLFPIPNFDQVPIAIVDGDDENQEDGVNACFACLTPFIAPEPANITISSSKGKGGSEPKRTLAVANASNSGKYQCPKCKNQFCLECDIFIHENLHNCPGCT